MKKLAALILAVILLLGMALAESYTEEEILAILKTMGYNSIEEYLDDTLGPLSPDNKCPVHPQIYITARYKDKDKQQGYDVKDGFSARMIQQHLERGNREFGLYFKFTPGGGDINYTIERLDIVIHDPSGNKVFTDGFAQTMECVRGYYWSINFFSLDKMFRNLYSEKGSIPSGQYSMDVYFDRLWTGNVKFMVKK